MSSWQDKAIKALEDSLHPVPQELNTIDWKCALSDKSERLAQHICAFSNTANGGFLAFGIIIEGNSQLQFHGHPSIFSNCCFNQFPLCHE